MKVFLVVGARPNFMKIAPLYHEMKQHPESFEPVFVHTGQHYDEKMSKVFFDELELPRPDIYLGVGAGSHAGQTAKIMVRFEKELLTHQPEMVCVVGDVNSTIACALATVKVSINSNKLKQYRAGYDSFLQRSKIERSDDQVKRRRFSSVQTPIIAHIEAGERSFDFSMPEEINRVTTDILSDILFVTSEDSKANLLAEGIDPGKIFLVGNIMIDSIQQYLLRAKDSNILQRKQLKAGEFVLATLHRPGNVDTPDSLKMLLTALKAASEIMPIVFPMHPRTRKLQLQLPGDLFPQETESRLQIIEPVGYLDFLCLQSNARLILTDSGGVQVEASHLGVPCLTLRPNTEWQITIRSGANRLVNLEQDEIINSIAQTLATTEHQHSDIPLWDGKTSERIVKIFKQIDDNN